MKKILITLTLLLTLNSCIIDKTNKPDDEPLPQLELVGGWMETKQEIVNLNTIIKTTNVNDEDIVIFNEDNCILHYHYDTEIKNYNLLYLYEYKPNINGYVFNTNNFIIQNNDSIIIEEHDVVNNVKKFTYYKKISIKTSINLIILKTRS